LDAIVGSTIELVFWDERLTTAVAERALRERKRRSRSKGDVDAVAAAVILQGYLDAVRARRAGAETR
jgi:putative Holliday junction resolvase